MSRAVPAAIATNHLSKAYGRARGIVDVTLRVEVGEIFGFLGPNGAGKTTTIRTLLDLIHPSSGRAQIFGLDTRRDYVAVHRQVGNLPGELVLYPHLTGQQTLDYSAQLRGGVPAGEVARLAGRLDVDLQRPLHTLSKGNRQKIGLIVALMARPPLVIMDEPTSGLDPLVQQVLYELLEEVRADGRTIFFSSHVLPEVERLCNRVAIMRAGQLVTVAPVDSLKQHAVRRVDLLLDDAATAAQVAPVLATVAGVREAHAQGATVHIAVQGSLDGLLKAAAHYTVRNLVTYEPNLEEIFLSYYRAAAADAPAVPAGEAPP